MVGQSNDEGYAEVSKKMGKMSFRDAMGLVPDDLSDGAFWAMAHEIAGLDYGDGFDELAEEELRTVPPARALKTKRMSRRKRGASR